MTPDVTDRTLTSPGAGFGHVTHAPVYSGRHSGTITSVPNVPKTPRRTIRISPEEWQAAAEVAEARGENVSEVIRASLRRYVKRNQQATNGKSA